MSSEKYKDHDESKAKKFDSTDKLQLKKKKAPIKKSKGNTVPYNERIHKKCGQLIYIHKRMGGKFICPEPPHPPQPKKVVREKQTPVKVDQPISTMETPSPLSITIPNAPMKRKRVEEDNEEDQDEMRKKKRRKINDLALDHQKDMDYISEYAQKILEISKVVETRFKENSEDMEYVIGESKGMNGQRIGSFMTMVHQIAGVADVSKKLIDGHNKVCIACKKLVGPVECFDSPFGLDAKICINCFFEKFNTLRK